MLPGAKTNEFRADEIGELIPATFSGCPQEPAYRLPNRSCPSAQYVAYTSPLVANVAMLTCQLPLMPEVEKELSPDHEDDTYIEICFITDSVALSVAVKLSLNNWSPW